MFLCIIVKLLALLQLLYAAQIITAYSLYDRPIGSWLQDKCGYHCAPVLKTSKPFGLIHALEHCCLVFFSERASDRPECPRPQPAYGVHGACSNYVIKNISCKNQLS